jgi:hypothetical protein
VLTEYQQAQAQAMNEESPLSLVIQMAQSLGWMVYHQRPMRTQSGEWRTGVQGDKGFPDLVLTNGTKLLFIELKSETGDLRIDQERWIKQLRSSHYKKGVLVWRPSSWFGGEIESILSGKGE